jgi:hypothetical protein
MTTAAIQIVIQRGVAAGGKHKARIFASTLGLTKADAEELQVALLAAARNDEATTREQDEYGQRYEVKFTLIRNGQSAIICSAWIVRTEEDFPRLTTCYIS